MTFFTVGLTGGLASGKSTVLGIFEKLGIETLSADNIVYELMSPQGAAYFSIIEHFGQSILDINLKIDRAQLRSLVFNSPEKKRCLENILHPLVRQRLWEQRQNLTSSYVVIEIPLLTETKIAYHYLNRVLVIDCDEKLQLLRARQRSGLSDEQSCQIIKQQASRQERNNIAHDIIINDGNLAKLELKVKELHNKYLRLSQQEDRR